MPVHSDCITCDLVFLRSAVSRFASFGWSGAAVILYPCAFYSHSSSACLVRDAIGVWKPVCWCLLLTSLYASLPLVARALTVPGYWSQWAECFGVRLPCVCLWVGLRAWFSTRFRSLFEKFNVIICCEWGITISREKKSPQTFTNDLIWSKLV